MSKKRILLKLTGETFIDPKTRSLDPKLMHSLCLQIKSLAHEIQFGIVVGGGNFFRGKIHGTAMGITSSVGHQIGLLATMMNGLIVKDLLEQHQLNVSLFSAVSCPEIGKPLSQQAIDSAMENGHIVVFAGGTGNPFFTTDTTAVLRGLQIKAHEVWKATHIDGVYDADPRTHPNAQLLKQVSFTDALLNHLGIMDAPSYALAAENKQVIRVFSIFEQDALIKAAHDINFGSIIHVG